jgi:hypothetical protein
MAVKNNHAIKFNNILIELILILVAVILGMRADEFLATKIQNAKDKKQELICLSNILSDLNLSLEDLDRDLENHQLMLTETVKIMDYVFNGTNKFDSLKWDCLNIDFQFYPNIGGYESLKNIGFEIISDDSLRLSIINLFELDIKRIVDLGKEKSNTKDIKKIMELFVRENFKLSGLDLDTTVFRENKNYNPEYIENNKNENYIPKSIVPTDYNKLKNNLEFQYLLQKIYQIRQSKIQYYLGARRIINRIQLKICSYLANCTRDFELIYHSLPKGLNNDTCDTCCKLGKKNDVQKIKKIFCFEFYDAIK